MGTLLIVLLIVFAALIAGNEYGDYKRRKNSEHDKLLYEERLKKAPCKHGVAGANGDPILCEKCKLEIETKKQARIAEDARIKAEKEFAYQEWIKKIKLPEYLKSMDPEEFEILACDLFHRMGYKVEHTPYSGDSGIDAYLRKDNNLTILQCKRVKGSVGEPILRDLFGSMHATGAKEGIVVTTGKVSAKARDWSKNKPIKIIETEGLIENIRIYYKEDDIVPESFIPNPDKGSYCPRCGSPMRVINWHGRRFWGCSAYPSCKYTKPYHQ